jgi:CRISPR-associated protein Cas5d
VNISSNPTVRVVVSGEVACFRRPEFTDDLVTYDVMTPAVARRLLDSVHAIAGGHWEVSSIKVLKPIRFRWDQIVTARGRRKALVLTDVSYLVEAMGMSATDDDCDHKAAFFAALAAGNGKAHLGLADFPASLALLPDNEDVRSDLAGTGMVDLGWMLYDTAKGKRGQFFRASMTNGVIDLSRKKTLALAS